MTSVKKVKVALLALVAALVIAIPTAAFADGTIEITSKTTGDEYAAYQVFKGDYDATAGVLSNVDWGTGVNGAAILADAKLPASLQGAKDAADLAKKLSVLENDSDDMKAFADVVAAHLTSVKSGNFKADSTGLVYKSESLKDGYYLVEQGKAGKYGEQDGAKTRFIAKLVGGDAKAEAKASVPQVEKGVIEDSKVNGDAEAFAKALANYNKAADYDIAQGIPYYISGTLPSTYDDYKTYYYKFTDHMSNGLDYVAGSAKIYIYNGTEQGTQIEEASDVVIDWTKPNLTVTITDLKKYVENYNENIKIVVLYQAKLNANAVIGGAGNPNDVKLTYSNNPNQESGGEPETGDTPKKYAVVFTYGINDTKVDGADDTTPLEKAKFVLRCDSGEFAGKYAVIADGKLTGWADKGSQMVSQADGTFGVKGLDAGTYTLIEEEPPAGYNKRADYTFTISAELPADSTVVADTGNAVSNLKTEKTTGSAATGMIEEKITNEKGTSLPSTGGIGTTIFYIVGIGLILAAAITLVVRRRNATTA